MNKAIFFIALLLLLSSNTAWGQPTRTAQAASADILGDSSEAFTVPAGSNILKVGVGLDTGTREVLGITYNGIALSRLTRVIDAAQTNSVELWYLTDPATGSNTLAIDLESGTDPRGAVFAAYSGVDTATPFTGTDSQDFGSVASYSTDVTCAAGNMAVDAIATTEDETLTVDGSQSLIGEVENYAAGSMGMSDEAGAGTTAMAWTAGTPSSAVQIVTCLMAEAAAANFGPLRRRH